MRTSRWIPACAIVALLVSIGLAEDAAEAPGGPSPEHEALGMWVGKWAGSGEMKAGPFGPGGPMQWTETCSWFGGARFHVVCESEGTGPMGAMKGLGISGYDPESGKYTHYGIDTNGWTGHARGTRDGDRWSFESEESMGGQTYYSRFSMTMETPTRMAFRWEMSEDGKTWVTMMDGVSRKQ